MYLLNIILGLTIIFISSYLYVNSTDYIADKFKISREFLSSIISPLFTSFPELITVLIAIFIIKGMNGQNEAIGTIFGDIFIVVMIFIPILLLIFKKNTEKNYAFLFLAISLLISLLKLINNFITGVILIFIYFYFNYHIRKSNKNYIEFPEIPIFKKIFKNSYVIVLQIFLSVIGIYFGSSLLLNSLIELSYAIGIDILILSILLIPLGTALPEIIISLIWSKKGFLSMGINNLIGESILYSTIYIGILSIFNIFYINWSIIYTILSMSVFSTILFFNIRKFAVLGPILFIIFLFI